MTGNGGKNGWLRPVMAAALALGAAAALAFCLNGSQGAADFLRALAAAFTSSDQRAMALYTAVPVLLTGLGTALALRSGMLNLGCPGQFTLGAACGLLGSVCAGANWWQGLLLSALGGAAAGMLPAVLLNRRKVDEALTAALLNWPILYLVNFALLNVEATAGWLTDGVVPQAALLPTLGLDGMLGVPFANVSWIVSALLCAGMELFFARRVRGWEASLCGASPRMAEHAGIRTDRVRFRVMAVSGALCGLAGGVYYLGGAVRFTLAQGPNPLGFYGVAAAMLGMGSAWGVALAALFFGFLLAGAAAWQARFPRELADVVLAVIVCGSAAPGLIHAWTERRLRREAAL